MNAEQARADIDDARDRLAADVDELVGRLRHPVRRRPRRAAPVVPAEAQPPSGPRSADPGLSDLSADLRPTFVRALKRFQADNMSSVGKGVAYGAFFAIPSAMIVALGILNLTAGPSEIDRLVARLNGVVPQSALQLIRQNLHQVSQSQGGGLLVIVGLVLAVFSLTGAVQTAMWGLNVAYERREQRGFVRQRLSALAITAILTLALVAVFAVLVLAPYMTGWVGNAVGQPHAVSWIWWTLQWPALFVVLLLAFAGILYLGPDVDHPRFRFLTPGAVVAALLWIAGSALFGVYAAGFASYNKAWGALAGVVITLTWLWLCAVSILLAAEVNAEVERTREMAAGTPGDQTLTVAHND